MASGGGASARILTIAGAQLQPDQAAADLGELDADAASQLATYIGANAALVKLTFAARCGRVTLVADVVKMDLSSKGIDMHGARIIASFLPRWYVGARACRRARGADPRRAMPRSRETNGILPSPRLLTRCFFQRPIDQSESQGQQHRWGVQLYQEGGDFWQQLQEGRYCDLQRF